MTKTDIEKLLPNIKVYENEPMSAHTTFKVGGPARLFVTLEREDDIVKLLSALKSSGEKFEIIGRGSNLLVSDEGYDGVIVCINNKDAKALLAKNSCSLLEANASSDEVGDHSEFYAPGGDSLITLSTKAREAGLSGLEFACGIPGTVGGAIIMNAGAHGGEISSVVKSVRVLRCSPDNKQKTRSEAFQTETFAYAPGVEVIELSNSEMNFRYRGSLAMDEGLVVLGATFALKKGDKEEIAKKMQENLSKRALSQPLEFPSAGSTFKRPEGDFAGRLIEEAGLKGHTIGGAMVSEKHAGFIVNTGAATASDIATLCDYVTKTVYEKCGVKLELEIRKIGF